jgi:hypothetical protein
MVSQTVFVILLGVKICCSAREKAMKKQIYVRTQPFVELLSGVDSLCKLGNQFTSVISTLDALFTKVKGQLPFCRHGFENIFIGCAHAHPVLTFCANGNK